jgi:hypothetical protein
MGKTAQSQLALALGTLLLGTLVYLLDRPADQAFVPSALSLFEETPRVFGRLGHNLPAFTHVLAFSLLTVALLGSGKRTAFTICSGWMAINAAFELGQHPALAPTLATLIPPRFFHIPILDKTQGYFLHGTFDPWDLLAIALGGLTAYVAIQKTRGAT